MTASWRRAALAAVAAAACATQGPPPPPPELPGDTAQGRYPDLVAATEKALGATFPRQVPVEILEDAPFRARAEAIARATPAPPPALAEQRRVLVALGAIAADADLAASIGNLRASQVALFDPARGALLVRASAPGGKSRDPNKAAEREANDAIVRALAYALDAQRGARPLPAAPEGDDARSAAELLRDGDAELAARRAAAPGLAPEALLGALEAVRKESAAANTPPFARELWLSRRADGALLADALARSGGRALVERALAAPPATTEQALHPEKYLAGERPAQLALPPDDSILRSRGYARVAERGLGELALRAWAGLWLGRDAGVGVAAGWDGDLAAVYAKPGAPDALLWQTAWDTDADAAEAEAAFLAFEANRGREGRSGECVLVEHGERADAVCRAGRGVALVREVPADVAAYLAGELARAKRTEVAAAPPLPGARFVPAASGFIATSRGREEGQRYVHPELGYAISRPAEPPLRFAPGRTSIGRRATPVTLEDPAGAATLEVVVLPERVDPRVAAEAQARELARNEGGGSVSPPEALQRDDGRPASAVLVEGRDRRARVVAVAGGERTYLVVAAWVDSASLVTVDAFRRAQDSFEVLGPPPRAPAGAPARR